VLSEQKKIILTINRTDLCLEELHQNCSTHVLICLARINIKLTKKSFINNRGMNRTKENIFIFLSQENTYDFYNNLYRI